MVVNTRVYKKRTSLRKAQLSFTFDTNVVSHNPHLLQCSLAGKPNGHFESSIGLGPFVLFKQVEKDEHVFVGLVIGGDENATNLTFMTLLASFWIDRIAGLSATTMYFNEEVSHNRSRRRC